jgi:hypothetical protein
VEVPSEEEFLAWLEHPVTKAYLRVLKIWREDLKEQWAQGCFRREDFDASQEALSAAMGQSTLLAQLQELEYETLVGGLERDGQ